MKKSNKKYAIVVLVVLLLALAVGYAALTDVLTISGTANAKGTFDLEFQNASLVKSEGVDETGTTITISTDKNTATVVVKDLAYPGAGAQFHVDIKNVGTVPAKLKAVTPTGVDDKDIKVTFPDLATGEKIAAGGTCGIDFTVVWDKDSTLTEEKTLSFSLELEYEQDTTAFDGSAAHADA